MCTCFILNCSTAPTAPRPLQLTVCCDSACRLPVAIPVTLFFYVPQVDDLRVQLHASGPGVLGPGCSLLEGGACSRMVTPNFDALANISTVFAKNYVQHAVCSCSRTSLLTSRRPDATHVWDLYSYWRDVSGNFTSIPQWFREQGYFTAGSGKIYHPGHASGLNASLGRAGDDMGHGPGDRSWSEAYYHSPNLGYWSSNDGTTVRFRAGASWAAVPPEVEAAHPLPDAQVADNAVATLGRLSSSEARGGGSGAAPFFLALGFYKPHLPFVFPAAKLLLYPASEVALPADQAPPAGMPPIAWSSYGELRAYSDVAALNTSGAPGTALPPPLVRELRRAYYAAVSHTDEQLGKVLGALRGSGLSGDTVVALWGDVRTLSAAVSPRAPCAA
eukprot:SAG11_NODE_6034_length_1405_cov_1.530628_1_plen_387_part_01